MTCAYCLRDVDSAYRVVGPTGEDEHICLPCKRDVDYCAASGRVPQDPGDD